MAEVDKKNLDWTPTDKIPMRSSKYNWCEKLMEFMKGEHTIAFLQFESIRDMKTGVNGLRNARSKEELTGDDVRISENTGQLRVYVAKRLTQES